jgi:hypothetical protein
VLNRCLKESHDEQSHCCVNVLGICQVLSFYESVKHILNLSLISNELFLCQNYLSGMNQKILPCPWQKVVSAYIF